MSDAIEISVTRSQGDMFRGMWAVFFRSPIGLLFIPVLGGLFVWSQQPEDLPELVLFLVAFAAWCALFFPTMFMFFAWNCMRLPGMRDVFHFKFTAEILSVTSQTFTSETKWDHWSSAFETASLLIIRARANATHFLPKNQIAPDALVRLKALLAVTLNGKVKFKSSEVLS